MLRARRAAAHTEPACVRMVCAPFQRDATVGRPSAAVAVTANAWLPTPSVAADRLTLSPAELDAAFAGALFLMFIILLAQFNSIYNSILVLLAVILSTTGVLMEFPRIASK